jgi:hypothetical protein
LPVEGGDVVTGAFHVGRTSRSGEAGVEEHPGAGARSAQGHRQKVVQAFLSSRPSPNMASRSWAENC